MKKKEKEEAVAVLAKAEVNNNINLTLNSNDVVDLLVEETRDKLIARYKELRDSIQRGSFKDLNSDELKKLIANRLASNPFFRLGMRQYGRFSVKQERLNDIACNRSTRIYSDDQLESEEYVKRENGYYDEKIYHLPQYEPVGTKALLRVDFNDSDGHEGPGVALHVDASTLLDEINEELKRINTERNNILVELGNVMASLRSLNTKRAKAKFVRSVLGNSPEGKEVLATIGSISIAPKLLK